MYFGYISLIQIQNHTIDLKVTLATLNRATSKSRLARPCTSVTPGKGRLITFVDSSRQPLEVPIWNINKYQDGVLGPSDQGQPGTNFPP